MNPTNRFLPLALLLALITSVQISAPDQISSPSVDSQYVPIAKRYPGIFIGSPTAALTMELVYDPTCIPPPMKATAAQPLTTSLGTPFKVWTQNHCRRSTSKWQSTSCHTISVRRRSRSL